MRKIGFAIGGSDLEADVKMTIIPNGNVGIGTSAPLYKLHVESDEAAMTSNPLNVNNFVLEPTYQALFSKLTVTTKFGAHAGIYGYDLSNTPAGSYAITGIGVFGKSENRPKPLSRGKYWSVWKIGWPVYEHGWCILRSEFKLCR